MSGVPDLLSDKEPFLTRWDSPPTEWVTVSDIRSNDKSALLLQILDDLGIRLLHVPSNVIGDLLSEPSGAVQGAGRDLIVSHDAVGDGDSVIVLTKGRGLVDDTSTRAVSDICVGNDSESSVLVLLGEVVEDGDVSPSNHVLSLESSDLLELGLGLRVRLLLRVVAFVQGGKEALEKDEVGVSLEVVDFDVSEVGVDTQSQVGGQGPRRGSPGEEGGGRVVDERERDGNWSQECHLGPFDKSTHQRDR